MKKMLKGLLACSTLLLCCLNLSYAGVDDAELCEADIELAMLRLKHFPELADWTVSTGATSIVLKSNFKIQTSSARSMVVDAEEDIEELPHQHFEIKILFHPIESFEHYKSLIKKRESYADMLNRDMVFLEGEALDDASYEKAWKFLKENPSPTHAAGETLVTIQSTLDQSELSIKPDTQMQKAVWMLHRVGYLFSEVAR